MQIFERKFPDAEELWPLVASLMANDKVWRKETFKDAVKSSGLRRISERKGGYFAFSAFEHVTGQAVTSENLIEEVRIFVGNEPPGLSIEAYEKDRHKTKLLAKKYVELFKKHMGLPRVANDNKIFEINGFRVRVLAAQPVWVVVSSLEVLQQLPDDWWAAPHA